MKKKIITILTAIIVLLGGGVAVDQLGGFQEARFNMYNEITSSATTTASYFSNAPVYVLELDANRRYAHFHNNSDTDMYLYCRSTALDYTGTGATNNATTTINELNGIVLAAEDGDNLDDDYVMTPDNMCYGHVYASSTAASKEILVNYN